MASTSIVDRIAERIFGSSLAIKVERELADEASATRQAQAAELVTLEAQLSARVQAEVPVRGAAAADVAAHEAALKVARGHADDRERAYRLELWDLEQRRDRLKGSLRWTASPQIAAFVAELRALLPATFDQRDAVVERAVDGRDYVRWTNQGSIIARVDAIRSLISNEFSEAGAMWYEALDEATLTAWLDAVRATIPLVESRPRQYRLEAAS